MLGRETAHLLNLGQLHVEDLACAPGPAIAFADEGVLVIRGAGEAVVVDPFSKELGSKALAQKIHIQCPKQATQQCRFIQDHSRYLQQVAGARKQAVKGTSWQLSESDPAMIAKRC